MTAEFDKLITLAEAVKLFPHRGGRPTPRATMYRWVKVGVGGVKLRAWLVGGSWCTTVRAIEAFIEACTNRKARVEPAAKTASTDQPALPKPQPIGVRVESQDIRTIALVARGPGVMVYHVSMHTEFPRVARIDQEVLEVFLTPRGSICFPPAGPDSLIVVAPDVWSLWVIVLSENAQGTVVYRDGEIETTETDNHGDGDAT